MSYVLFLYKSGPIENQKKERGFEIVRRMVYLRPRSHGENINRIFPVIKQSFRGNFIELDFSKMLVKSLNGKYKVHFLESNTAFIVL